MKSITLLFVMTLTSFVYSSHEIEFDETKIQAPWFDSNEEMLRTTVCRSRLHSRWNYCSYTNDKDYEKIKDFNFMNWGPNKIVSKPGFGIGRSFEFMFEGFARSDLGLLIWDSPDNQESHGHLKLMMFFPRLVLPAIRYEADKEKDILIVTLPTREEVVFNTKTKEVTRGALSESPIEQDAKGIAIVPGITYLGNGVVIEANRINDYPVGSLAQFKNNLATIKKKGFKDCKVSVKELWYTDESKGENVFFNKQYVTDEAFDQFLKQRCQFSMY